MYLFSEIFLSICSSTIWHWRVRKILYKIAGMEIGKAAIHSGCYFSGNKLSIGNGSYINRRGSFDCINGKIYIGNNVGIAHNVQIYTTNHDYSTPTKRTGKVISSDVHINDGAWIGGGVIICPGVEIGRGTIVAAGSVVINNCKENCLYGGNPAKLIKEL